MIKRKQSKLKRKPQKSAPRNKFRTGERGRLKRLVADLRQSRDDLGDKNRKQTDQLKIKNGKLRNGDRRQIKAEEQINICTKAMEAAADGIFIIDAQQQNFPIIYANQSLQKITGYEKKEILGRDYFLFYRPSVDPHIVSGIKQMIREGKSFHGEMFNFKKSGKKYWNLLRIAPVRDSQGAITHYVGTQTDVTSMREKEQELNEQREELLHVTRVGKLAEFVSSLAHEINQPLTAILSYSQAAQRMLADREPELKKILSYIIQDDQRAAEVIQRLRLLLRKSKPEMKSLDINSLINETIVLIATDATMRNSVIKTEFDTKLPFIRGDQIQLQQVVLNLISNSFDAMEKSSSPHQILIRTSRKDDNTIIVEMSDTGCGIPAQNILKLFTHFFTSKTDGLGMGLSISRSIVEAHGGRLDVKNNSDSGATFYFTVPIDKKDA